MEKQSTSRLLKLVVSALALFLLLACGVLFAGCGEKTDTPNTPVHSHNYQPDNSKSNPSTCVETGYIVYTCTDCKDSYAIVTCATGEHQWDQGKCKVCGIKQGYDEKAFKELLDQINANVKDIHIPEQHSHAFNKDTFTASATCTSFGFTLKTCECGAVTVSGLTEPTGHSFVDDPSHSVDATCTQQGWTATVCENCGATSGFHTPMLEHNYEGAETQTHPATCKEDGFTFQLCSVCGYQNILDIIPKTSQHSYQKIGSVPATCMTPAQEIRECSVCLDTQFVPIGEPDTVNGHDWVANEDQDRGGYDPDHCIPGLRTYTCSLCGQGKKEQIPGGDHAYFTKSTDEDGNTVYSLQISDDENDIIELEFKDGGWRAERDGEDVLFVVDSDPTCELSGHFNRRCWFCGMWEKTDENIDWDNPENDPLNFLSDDLYGRDTVKETEDLDPVGHTIDKAPEGEEANEEGLVSKYSEIIWDNDYHYETGDTTKQFPKNTKKISYYVCEVCGKHFTKDEDGKTLNGEDVTWEWHTWTEYTGTGDEAHSQVLPTCTEKGYTWYYCQDTNCTTNNVANVWYKKTTEELGHLFSFDATKIKKAGRDVCIEPGTIELVCARETGKDTEGKPTTCGCKLIISAVSAKAEEENYFKTYTKADNKADWTLKILQAGESDEDPVDVTGKVTFVLKKASGESTKAEAVDELLTALMPNGHNWQEMSRSKAVCNKDVTVEYICKNVGCTAKKTVVEENTKGHIGEMITYKRVIRQKGCPANFGAKTETVTYCSVCGEIVGEPVVSEENDFYKHFPFDLDAIEEAEVDLTQPEIKAIWDKIEKWYTKNFNENEKEGYFTTDIMPYLWARGAKNCREGYAVSCYFCDTLIYQVDASNHQFNDVVKEDGTYDTTMYLPTSLPDCTTAGSEGYGYCTKCGLWINLTTLEPIKVNGRDAQDWMEAREATYKAPKGHSFVYGAVMLGDCTHGAYMGWYCENCFTPEAPTAGWTALGETKTDFVNPWYWVQQNKTYKNDRGTTSNYSVSEDLVEFFKKLADATNDNAYFDNDAFGSWMRAHGYADVWEAIGYSGEEDKEQASFESRLGRNAYIIQTEEGYVRGDAMHTPANGNESCVRGNFKVTLEDGKVAEFKNGVYVKGTGEDLTTELKKLGYDPDEFYYDQCKICKTLLKVTDHTYELRRYNNLEDAKKSSKNKSDFEILPYYAERIYEKDGKWYVDSAFTTEYSSDKLPRNIFYLQYLYENDMPGGVWAVIEDGNGGWTPSCWFANICKVCGKIENNTHLDPNKNEEFFLFDVNCSQNRTCPICGYELFVKPMDLGHSMVEMPVIKTTTVGTTTTKDLVDADGTSFTSQYKKDAAKALEKEIWIEFIEENPFNIISQLGTCKLTEDGDPVETNVVYVCWGCVIAWYKNEHNIGGTFEDVKEALGEAEFWQKFAAENVVPTEDGITKAVDAHMTEWQTNHVKPEGGDEDTAVKAWQAEYDAEKAKYEKELKDQLADANYAVVKNSSASHTWDESKTVTKYYAWAGNKYVLLDSDELIEQYDPCRYQLFKQTTKTCSVCNKTFSGTESDPTDKGYDKVGNAPTHYVVPAEKYFTETNMLFVGSTEDRSASMKFTCVVCGATTQGVYTYEEVKNGTKDDEFGNMTLVIDTTGKKSSSNISETVAFVKDITGTSVGSDNKTMTINVRTLSYSSTSEKWTFNETGRKVQLTLSTSAKSVKDSAGAEYNVYTIYAKDDGEGEEQKEVVGWSARYMDTVSTTALENTLLGSTEGKTEAQRKEALLKYEIAHGGTVEVEEDVAITANTYNFFATHDVVLDIAEDATLSLGGATVWGNLTIKGGEVDITGVDITVQLGGSLTLDGTTVKAKDEGGNAIAALGYSSSANPTKLVINNSVVIGGTTGFAINGNANQANVEIDAKNSTFVSGSNCGVFIPGAKKATFDTCTFFGGSMAVHVRGGDDVSFTSCTFIAGQTEPSGDTWGTGSTIAKNAAAALVLGNGLDSEAYGNLKVTLTSCTFAHATENTLAGCATTAGEGKTQIGESGYYYTAKTTDEEEGAKNMAAISITVRDSKKVELTLDDATFTAMGGSESANPFEGHLFKAGNDSLSEKCNEIKITLGSTDYDYCKKD